MKRRILNSSLVFLLIGSQFSPVILSAATINGKDNWGVQSGNTQMKNTYPNPTENWEDLMVNATEQPAVDSKYHRVTNLDDKLTDLAKNFIHSEDMSEGIIFNSSQTQAQVTSNLTWSGSAWSETSVSGNPNLDYERSIVTSGVTNQSFKVKEYATYFNIETGETELLDMNVNIEYTDATKQSNGGLDVSVRPGSINWNKLGTDELVINTTFYKTGTNTVVDAPVMYHLTDFDNGGTFGIDNRDVYGVWSYLPTTTGAWGDVYNSYDAGENVFSYKTFWDQLSSDDKENSSCSRYYTKNDRTIYQNIGNFDNSPSGNLTPSERGLGRLKFVTKGNYTTIVDGWSTNSNNNSSATSTCTMETNGKDGEIAIVMDAESTITISQMAAVANYGLTSGSTDTLIMRPFDYQAIISAEKDASGDEGVVRSDSELLNLMDVNYNNPDGRVITVDQSAIDYNTPGTYPVTFTIDSTSSGSFTTTANYTVNNIVPTITGSNTATVELGSSEITDFISTYGLSSYDATEYVTNKLSFEFIGDEPVVVDGKYSKTGTYKILVTSNDDKGYGSVTKELTLNIVRDIFDGDSIDSTYDIDSPIVTANEKQSDNEHKLYTDEELIDLFDVTGNWDDSGFRTLSVDSSEIDFNTPGEYNITFTVKDNISGETDSVTAIYEVLDVLPTITADKEYTVTLNQLESNYKSIFNVVATEINTNDLNNLVTINVDDDLLVDSNGRYIKTGDFDITFTAIDDEGNEVSTTSILHVIRDIEAEIDLIDNNTDVISLELDADKIVEDNENIVHSDEELIDLFNVTGNFDLLGFRVLSVDQSAIDYDTPGVYPVTFTNTDSISGDKKTVTVKYQVLDVLPTITADNEINITLGDDELNYLTSYNVVATEFTNNDLLDDVKITFDNDEPLVTNGKYSKTGTYPITFTVSDDEGNEVSTHSTLNISRNITDVEVIDNTIGTKQVQLNANTYYEDYEHKSYTDEELIKLFNVTGNWDDNFITLSVDQSNINYEKPGIYDVNFTVTENISKESKTIHSSYRVLDVLPTMKGDSIIFASTINPIDVESESEDGSVERGKINELLNYANLSATEFIDGDISESITYKHNIDLYTSGIYEVFATAIDSDGNTVDFPIIVVLEDFSNIGPEGTSLTVDDFFTEWGLNESSEYINITENIDYDVPAIYPVEVSYKIPYTYIFDKQYNNLSDEMKELFSKYYDYEDNNTLDVEDLNDALDNMLNPKSMRNQENNSEADNESGQYNTDDKFVEGEIDATYEVVDVLPTITANEEASIIIGDSVDYLELFNPSATELEDGDLTSKIEVDSSNVDETKIGTYDVIFNIIDDEGNIATTISKLNILSLENITGDNLVSKPEHEVYSDEELIELFNVDSSGDVEVTHTIDFEVPNTYPVTFTTIDKNSGERLNFEADYEVTDVLPTINGKDLYTIILSDVTDAAANDNSQNKQIDTCDDVYNDGYYSVDKDYPYWKDGFDTAKDENKTGCDDSTKGEVSWKDLSSEEKTAYSNSFTKQELVEYFDIIATEFESGDLTDRVTVDDSNVNYEQTGEYDIIFTVSDDENNTVTHNAKLKIVSKITAKAALENTGAAMASIILAIILATLSTVYLFLRKRNKNN